MGWLTLCVVIGVSCVFFPCRERSSVLFRGPAKGRKPLSGSEGAYMYRLSGSREGSARGLLGRDTWTHFPRLRVKEHARMFFFCSLIACIMSELV